jgi:uncharacterized protein YfaT (DUF1175 family)
VTPDNVPSWSDRALDGTPDFLRLDTPRDRETFTRWFTWLAETQAYRTRNELPAEIVDCAALIRYAYRESLRRHDARWATEHGLETAPPAGDLVKYRYPFTPLRAALFRIQPGPFTEADLRGAAFAEFADARTLMRFNSHFVSRDLERARPGDLLFYKQLEQSLPFHAMIYVGASQFEPDTQPVVVYHTGPIGRDPGEIRRPAVRDLLHHPQPRWRPHPGNPNFLGVYRWNILREDS